MDWTINNFSLYNKRYHKLAPMVRQRWTVFH